MSREEAIEVIKQDIPCEHDIDLIEALKMAIQALSQEFEIKENIIKYMKKYPNHVGNTDFWEGFYACRNVVLQLDDEEYAPKEQEPCDDAISREAAITSINKLYVECEEWRALNDLQYGTNQGLSLAIEVIEDLPSVTPKPTECEDAVSREPCRTCKYGEIYNDEWCRCTHYQISGCRVRINDGCVVERDYGIKVGADMRTKESE